MEKFSQVQLKSVETTSVLGGMTVQQRIEANVKSLGLNWDDEDIATLTAEVEQCGPGSYKLVDEFMAAWKQDAIKEGKLHLGYRAAEKKS